MNVAYEDQRIDLVHQRLWYALYGAGAIIGGLIMVVCALIEQPKRPGFVVAVDTQGHFLQVGRPILAADQFTPSLIRWALGEYIRDAFRIEMDRDTENDHISTVWNWSRPESRAVLQAFYQKDKGANDPVMLGPKFHQQVVIKDVLALKVRDTYQVDFQTIRTPYGQSDGVTKQDWRATMKLELGEPSEDSPGIYVSNLDFSPEAQ